MESSQAEGSGLRIVHLFALTPVSRVPYNGGKQQIQTSVLISSLLGSVSHPYRGRQDNIGLCKVRLIT